MTAKAKASPRPMMVVLMADLTQQTLYLIYKMASLLLFDKPPHASTTIMMVGK